jgi:hypothetical protein
LIACSYAFWCSLLAYELSLLFYLSKLSIWTDFN